MKEKNKIIVIPDVHGRKFWKDIFETEAYETAHTVVFLGDYLDPYPDEGITREDTIENFKKIIEFARKNENVHLLYGNHDLEYAIGKDVCCCRCDFENYETIKGLFDENKDLFKLCYNIGVNDKLIVFSHAGFHPLWVEKWKITPNNINSYADDEVKFDKLRFALCDFSFYRGGYNSAGSVVWSDLREFFDVELPVKYEQIVGHTMLNGDRPIRIKKKITCIDLSKPFVVNEYGDLEHIDGSKVDIVEV